MIRQLIQSQFENFSKTEQIIANSLLERMDELPFMNATQIAASLQLYPSSITRFSQKLGFKGYPGLQQAIRLELRTVLASGATHDTSSVLARHLRNEAENIEDLQSLAPETIQAVVELLTYARRVWVFGERSSAGTAQLLAHFLGFLRPDVRHLSSAVGLFPEDLLNVSEGDVLVVFTLQRYSRLATRVAQECGERGAQLVLISDGGASPLNQSAVQRLDVRVRAVGGFVSLTAMMSVTILLGIACAENLGTERLMDAEGLWERFELYEKPGRK